MLLPCAVLYRPTVINVCILLCSENEEITYLPVVFVQMKEVFTDCVNICVNPHLSCLFQDDNRPPDHAYGRKRKRPRLQTTRKISCSARIIIKYFTRYPEFAVADGASRETKAQCLDRLREELCNDVGEERIFVSLPKATAHTGHAVTKESGCANRVHPKVIEKIYDLVSMGITSAPLVRKTVKVFVEQELCTGTSLPDKHDRTFYPTRRDIRSHIHKALASGRYSQLDQENLEKKIDDWKYASPGAHYFFRMCQDSDNGDHGDDCCDSGNESSDTSEMSPRQNKLLFVHMEEWQCRLLVKYGNTLSLLDATYKMTKYALPLFLLCVRSNVGYMPVAEFICQEEDAASIAEALSIIKEWNEDWKPASFMVDFCEAEHNAITEVFKDTEVRVCTFHREQAWERWCRDCEYMLHSYHHQTTCTHSISISKKT